MFIGIKFLPFRLRNFNFGYPVRAVQMQPGARWYFLSDPGRVAEISGVRPGELCCRFPGNSWIPADAGQVLFFWGDSSLKMNLYRRTLSSYDCKPSQSRSVRDSVIFQGISWQVWKKAFLFGQAEKVFPVELILSDREPGFIFSELLPKFSWRYPDLRLA